MEVATTITVALGGLLTGAVVPYLYSLFHNQKAKLDKETKDILEKHGKTLEHIKAQQEQISRVHGLNPDDIECKDAINNLLEQLRQHVGATRCTVWAFHNGNYFTSGNPQRRLTTVFEAIDHRKSKLAEYDLIKGELLNGFAGVLKELLMAAGQNVGGAMVDYGRVAYDPCEKCEFDKRCILHPMQRPKYCFLRCEINSIPVGTKFSRVMNELGTEIFWGHIMVDDFGSPIGVLTMQYDADNQESYDAGLVDPLFVCEKTQQIKNSLRNLQNLT